MVAEVHSSIPMRSSADGRPVLLDATGYAGIVAAGFAIKGTTGILIWKQPGERVDDSLDDDAFARLGVLAWLRETIQREKPDGGESGGPFDIRTALKRWRDGH